MTTNARNLANLLGGQTTLSAESLPQDIPLGPQQYSTVNNLPLSNNLVGDQAFVNENNRLYIWSGQGWYSVALINNSPAFDSGGSPDQYYTLDSNGGTPITIQLSATDPEDVPIQWSYIASDSAQYFADITQDSSVFTITAKPTSTIEQYDSTGGVFTITFKASDGINLATALSQFTISFYSSGDWTLASEQAKIQSSDIQAGDQFGYSVSISGDGNTAIVGARLEDTGGTDAGAAYIFTRDGSTWSQQAKIQSSDIQPDDDLGYSVSISGDGNTTIIGARLKNTGSTIVTGAAYIFTRDGSTWSQQAKIQSSDIQAVDRFGNSVSISADGNTAIIGSYGEDTGGNAAGAAYIFTRDGSTWSQQAKIQSSDIQAVDEFGISVSISGDGDTAIVGAHQHDAGGTDAGAAYIFTRDGSTWSQQAKIQSSDIEASDNFGYSVSISGDGNTAIIASSGEDTGGSNAGAAYIFTRDGSTWIQQAKIQSSDIEAVDQFGWSVSISGDGNTAIVGARLEDTGGSNAGAAYIFTRDGSTWSQQAKIQASDVAADDYFGSSVSISGDGNTAIIASSGEDTGGTDAGAAYIFVAG